MIKRREGLPGSEERFTPAGNASSSNRYVTLGNGYARPYRDGDDHQKLSVYLQGKILSRHLSGFFMD